MEGWLPELHFRVIGCIKMEHYDDIVVGSGISGLTLAHLLGLNGHKVLLLEKSKHIGGSISRYVRNGISFDTGFHFTGGFLNKGILHDMLNVLGIDDYVKPIFLSDEKGQKYVFESDKATYSMPNGINDFCNKLKEYFPNESEGVDNFFNLAKQIYDETSSLDLLKISQSPKSLDEDYISLRDTLDKFFKDDNIKTILATYCMCYGGKTSEVSIANHCRVAYGLYDAVVRIKDGGDAFINAFKDNFSRLGINVKQETFITGCGDIKDNVVGRFILNTGEEVSCNQCIFTIHPKEVLNTLPKEHLSKAFIQRIEDFESSLGFFSVYGVVDSEDDDNGSIPSIVSIFPSNDLDQLLDPSNDGSTVLVIMRSFENVNGRTQTIITAMEPAFLDHWEKWKNSKTGKRADSYYEYKRCQVKRIEKRILDYYPEYKNTYRTVDASSILTYRDYLNSPDGSAYGIKQKIGQFNLFGKLPLKNVYAAGQSSALPGVVGAMMSSFIISRTIVGREKYDSFIRKTIKR